MLMSILRQGYREMTAPFAPEKPVSTVASQRPAANASTFIKAEPKLQRRGRLRRLNRSLSHSGNGWTVRTW